MFKKDPSLTEKLLDALKKQSEPKVGKGKKALIGAGVVSALVGIAAATSKKGESS